LIIRFVETTPRKNMNKENLAQRTDRELGMGRDIPRRDFLNGAAMTIGAALLPPGLRSNETKSDEPQNHAGYNPPVSTGLRGSHTGSFEIAHSLRDGTFWKNAAGTEQLAEKYDLIIVGGGISGLAAAHFYRERAGGSAKILILENHDDFGGHAKRNEFHLGGKLQLLNGGTMLIDSPTPYSAEAAGLMKKLGIDAVALDKKCSDPSFYRSLGLGAGVFFDRQTFGTDRLVSGLAGGEEENPGDATAAFAKLEKFLSKAPLSEAARRDILRVEQAKIDYFPALTLLVTPFELFERKIRDQLSRTLGAGAFDAARDIEAITVNRWPHGYGYEYNPLFDPEWSAGQAPHIVGRKRLGRISIANSDSGATAYTDVAMDQACRAVDELLSSNG
jgi:spermidine dehydrogenase